MHSVRLTPKNVPDARIRHACQCAEPHFNKKTAARGGGIEYMFHVKHFMSEEVEQRVCFT